MTTETLKPMSHSHSRLVTFSQCPLSYRLAYIDKVPAESSDALEIGAAAHEFFEEYVSKGLEIRFEKDQDAIDAMAAKCFQKQARNQDNYKDVLDICRTFVKAYKPDPAYPIVEPERQVAFKKHWIPCSWNDPEVMFRAKIDLIEEPAEQPVKKIRITDYKTGFSGQLNSFQLDVYAFVASLLYGNLEQVEIQFYYIKSGFKQVKLLEVKDLDVTRIQLEALMERIEGETKWKAKPGQRCLNCSVAASCSEKPSGLRAISSPDEAKTLGVEIALLESQAKAKKKALNSYCREHGAVEAGGLVYNHYPQENMVVDMGPFLSALVTYQIDPKEVLNPDSRAIKKAMKDTPGFQEAVTPYIGYDVTTRFYSKKAEESDE